MTLIINEKYETFINGAQDGLSEFYDSLNSLLVASAKSSKVREI